MYIIALDFGTSSLKGAILNEHCDVVVSSKVEYELILKEGNKVELDPDTLFKAFLHCVREFEEFLPQVELIAFDTLSPSVVFMDRNGEALYPVITHLDRRSRNQTKQILNRMGDEFHKITGVLPFPGGVSITTILWMKENMPEVYSASHKIGHFNTYFYKKLTGEWVTDPVNASQMGLFETVGGQKWAKDICATFGIDISKLPEIVPAGTIVGKLCKEIADLTNLREGIPVAVGSNDAATAQVGAGNFSSGDVLNISGSSEILSILTDKPVIHKKYYLRNAVTPGLWQIFAISTGGFAVDWFRRELCREMSKEEFYNEYITEVIENNLARRPRVRFLPYLAEDRHSLERKTGRFSGLTLATTREEMLMAVLVGMHEPVLRAFNLASQFLKLNNTIKLTGGLTSEIYIRLKEMLFKGYDFEVVQDCTLKGSTKLALEGLNNH